MALHKDLILKTSKRQVRVVWLEVKEFSNEEALLRQLRFILGIWSPLKVFTDLYCLFLTFTVDVTFGKILNVWDGKSDSR